jgi:hypothetical protein
MPEYDAYCRTALREKIPDVTHSEFARRLGDCLYDFSTSPPMLRRGVHSERERARDLSGMNALLSDHFYYFGDTPIDVPPSLEPVVHRSQGHKSRLNTPYESAFVAWVESLGVPANTLRGNPQGRPALVIGSASSGSGCDTPVIRKRAQRVSKHGC